VILTALELEYRAIRAQLTDPEMHGHPAGTLFEAGGLAGTSRQVVIAAVGQGNQQAGILAERAVALFQPAALLFVGVAGALADDLRLGDVVVATRVYAYHGGREDQEGFWARPRAWDAAHHLEQLARLVARGDRWADLVHFRPVAAGEVVLNSRDSPLVQQIRRHYDDAAAVEMESAGMAQAGHLSALPVLTIRAISDKADGRKYDADRAGWQSRAAASAAAFAAELCARLPVG
jgi:adenosylhomocysteine nucleosidase